MTTDVGDVPLGRSFDDFYVENVDRLRGAIALSIGDRDLADEAVAEAMARAVERWSKVATYDNPSGWVYRVALNYASSRFRRANRRILKAEVPDAATAGEWTAVDIDLARALEALKPHHRTVVVLRFQLDWTVDQIADALQVSAGTVKSRLSRAMTELRHALGSAR